MVKLNKSIFIFFVIFLSHHNLIFGVSKKLILIPQSFIGEINLNKQTIFNNHFENYFNNYGFEFIYKSSSGDIFEENFGIIEFQIIEDNNNYQVTIKLLNKNGKKTKSTFCENCDSKEILNSIEIVSNQIFKLIDIGSNLNENLIYWDDLNKKWIYDGNINRHGRYIGEIVNDIPNGYGSFHTTTGEKYEGKWVDGLLEGEGKLFYGNGTVYVGSFVNSSPNGYGVKTTNNGTIYRGYYTNSIENGEGTLSFPNGTYYTGEWEMSLPWKINGYSKNGNLIFRTEGGKGFGKYVMYLNGEYFGNFNEGKFDGLGKLNMFNGVNYEGTFKNGVFHGFGSLKEKNRFSYIGNFLNGKQNGKGEKTYIDNRKYIGDWENGKPTKRGIYILSDGSKYIGSWVNNNNWEGLYQSKNDHIFGYWSENKYTIEDNQSFKNDRYYGFFDYQSTIGERFNLEITLQLNNENSLKGEYTYYFDNKPQSGLIEIKEYISDKNLIFRWYDKHGEGILNLESVDLWNSFTGKWFHSNEIQGNWYGFTTGKSMILEYISKRN